MTEDIINAIMRALGSMEGKMDMLLAARVEDAARFCKLEDSATDFKQFKARLLGMACALSLAVAVLAEIIFKLWK